MRKPLLSAVLALALAAWLGAAGAATRYVSDQLSINLRRGPGTGYRIDTLIHAGDPIETLSQSGGWTKIRTANGDTGYVLTRFLSDQPAASARVESLQQKTRRLTRQYADLKKNAAATQGNIERLRQTKARLGARNRALATRLKKLRETSADAIRLSEQNKKYQKQLMALTSTVDRLKHENRVLESRREGMKIGALILFVGIIVGLLLSLLRRRRASSWSSF